VNNIAITLSDEEMIKIKVVNLDKSTTFMFMTFAAETI
jgi:hypothetical protein